jgi:Uma2 family endonuclease
MGTLQQTGLVTFAEFENLPDPREGHLELHHGQVVLMPPRKPLHVDVQQVLMQLLLPLTRGKGILTLELPFRPKPEYESWQADVGFVVKERWRKTVNCLSGAPELVIEVLSPSNSKGKMLDRQEICLSNGCNSFWTVDPKRRRVLVTGSDRQTVTYNESMSIPLPAPLCGEILVASIFDEPF